MSVKATNWAYERGRERELKQGPRFTLVRIADHADHDGVCWPGMAHIAEYTGAEEKTVRRHVQQLEDEGLLHRERESSRESGRGRSKDKIFLHLDLTDKLSGSSDPAPEAGTQGEDAGVPKDPADKLSCGSEGDQADILAGPNGHFGPDQADIDDRAPYREPSKEPSENQPGDKPPVGYLSDLLADLIAANDPDGLRPTVGRAWLVAERLMLEKDGRDVDQAEMVLRWCQADEFWRGNVQSMTKFRAQYGQLFLKANRRPRPRPRAVPAPQPQPQADNVYDLAIER